MKNFILVINKEKLYAYVLSICTIVTLFFMSSFINNNLDDSEMASSNVVENSIQKQTTNSIVPNDENEVNTVIQQLN